jgi:hypothetical protein
MAQTSGTTILAGVVCQPIGCFLGARFTTFANARSHQGRHAGIRLDRLRGSIGNAAASSSLRSDSASLGRGPAQRDQRPARLA